MSEQLTTLQRAKVTRTPQRKNSAVATAASGNTQVTATLSQASSPGNLLVAVVTQPNTGVFTFPAGWVKAAGVISTQALDMWYYINAPATTAVTATSTLAVGALALVVMEWERARALDVVASNSGLANSSATISTPATTDIEEFVVSALHAQTASSTATPSPGTRDPSQTGNPGLRCQYLISGPLAVQTLDEALSASMNWWMVAATFKRM